MKREDIQNAGVDAILTYKYVLLSWSTGVGKTRPAIFTIEKLPKKAKVLLLVAETLHKNNWKKEFKDVHKEHLLKNVTIECYASLKKYRNTSWDYIIMDEVHHINSTLRLDVLKTLNFKYLVGLSATIKRKLIENIEAATKKKFYISTVDLQNAIDNNILPEPTIYLIPLKLNSQQTTEEIVEEWGKKDRAIEYWAPYKDRWKFFMNRRGQFPNVKLHLSCTQQQKYQYLCEKISYYKNAYIKSKKSALEFSWLQWGTKRKLFLGELKTDIVKSFISKPKVNNKKYICFCTNIEQAETLGSVDAIHSKKLNNTTIVQEFNEDKRKHLFAVGMAVEGVNLSGIEAGIIVQLDGETLKFYQKFGRTTRAKDPVQYIFYYKNTRDEEYLKKALDGIDTKYIKEIEDYENFN